MSKPKATILQPPDGGYGWVVCISGFFTSFIVDGLKLGTSGLMVVIALDRFEGLTPIISSIIMLPIGVCGLVGIISCSLIRKYGCRIVAVTGSLMSSLTFIVSIWITNIFVLLLPIVLCGVGFGLTYQSSFVANNMYFERRRALAHGIFTSGTSVGLLVYPIITNYVLSHYGWEGVMVMGAISMGISALLSLAFKPLEDVIIMEDVIRFTSNTTLSVIG